MDIKKFIKEVKDFPIKGISFKDISPLLANANAFQYSVDWIAKECEGADVVASPDARGFLFGVPAALKNKQPFIMVRKPGKLPGETIKGEYELEYGTNTLEMQVNSIKKGQKVVIVDDVLATGGTVNAIIDLIKKQGGIVTKIIFLIELEFLNGKDKINNENIISMIKY